MIRLPWQKRQAPQQEAMQSPELANAAETGRADTQKSPVAFRTDKLGGNLRYWTGVREGLGRRMFDVSTEKADDFAQALNRVRTLEDGVRSGKPVSVKEIKDIEALVNSCLAADESAEDQFVA
jgi:hypothetical protein